MHISTFKRLIGEFIELDARWRSYIIIDSKKKSGEGGSRADTDGD